MEEEYYSGRDWDDEDEYLYNGIDVYFDAGDECQCEWCIKDRAIEAEEALDDFQFVEQFVEEALTQSDLDNSVHNQTLSYKEGTQMGQTFNTGNSVVRTLPVGTLLEVSGYGQLSVVEADKDVIQPVEDLQEGDRITTKHGPSTVVRLTNRLSEIDLEGYDVLYIADDTSVVRVANYEDVEVI